jgi:hypothetical protein
VWNDRKRAFFLLGNLIIGQAVMKKIGKKGVHKTESFYRGI